MLHVQLGFDVVDVVVDVVDVVGVLDVDGLGVVDVGCFNAIDVVSNVSAYGNVLVKSVVKWRRQMEGRQSRRTISSANRHTRLGWSLPTESTHSRLCFQSAGHGRSRHGWHFSYFYRGTLK